MSDAIGRGLVLVMSIWDDGDSHMQWLDGTVPAGSTKPGAARGTCPLILEFLVKLNLSIQMLMSSILILRLATLELLLGISITKCSTSLTKSSSQSSLTKSTSQPSLTKSTSSSSNCRLYWWISSLMHK